MQHACQEVSRPFPPLGRAVAWLCTKGPLLRSADLQSAVSQDCILRSGRKARRVGLCRRLADCKSAIRQSATLRYGKQMPARNAARQSGGGSAVLPLFSAILGRLILGASLLAGAGQSWALKYPSNRDLAEQLQKLAATHPNVVHLKNVAATRASNNVWFVELGAGAPPERQRRPALLLVAGIEGNDLAGTACALAWVERLAQGYENNDTLRRLLDSTSIYVFPRLNPDAAASFFSKPKWETAVSSLPVDDDHDGLIDEDSPEDLNGDGLITSMRIEDPEGEFILDPVDPRLLLKADRTKGEKGAWRYLSEGRDNDGDGAWNEDGAGGVNFNRNFPFNYKFFAPWAGLHQVSEAETRALADFVVDHPNIGIVFTFGAADNLVQTPKNDGGNKRPPTSLQEEDIPYYRELGKNFRDTLGLKKELQTISEPGTFSDWMYFHRGRISLAARAWSPALQLELAKSESKKTDDKAKENKEAKDEKTEPKKEGPAEPEKGSGAAKVQESKKASDDKRNEEDREFLKWLEAHSPESVVPWKAFDHPDFPGKKTEIGGLAPFAKTNPPESLLEELAQKQAKFLTELAGKFPRVGVRKAVAKHLGESVYEVTIQVENTGYLPTSLAQGNTTREVFPTRVVLDLDQKALLSGSKISMLGTIEGSGGMKELRYIVHAKDRNRVGVEVISMLGGSVKTAIDLKEGN
jgi:hypothetical protein